MRGNVSKIIVMYHPDNEISEPIWIATVYPDDAAFRLAQHMDHGTNFRITYFEHVADENKVRFGIIQPEYARGHRRRRRRRNKNNKKRKSKTFNKKRKSKTFNKKRKSKKINKKRKSKKRKQKTKKRK